MTELPVVPMAARVDISQLMYGNSMDNVLNFEYVGELEAPDEPALFDLVSLVYTSLVSHANFKAIRIPAWSVISVTGTILDGSEISVTRTIGMPIQGTASGDTANQQALVCTLYSALGGRSGRGRQFWGGISNENLVDGLWAGFTLTAINGMYAQLLTDLIGTDWVWSVLSYFDGGVVRTPPILNAVTSFAPRAVPATRATRRICRGA